MPDTNLMQIPGHIDPVTVARLVATAIPREEPHRMAARILIVEDEEPLTLLLR